ncbi:hypothetical protein Gasu_42870 isoform 2 [Galdieria sulphuraria]|uniref:Spindle assembly abnormal protein 6 N-terminal domain-containing protein n=1 Tax=Galdieria sulphuraria TaxID=130081 RepID=M2XXC9_GALSU|nr:hypothetical protein Gasu_42870 isoform 2 [Galdieria sulphuraria]EME28288.1 hypothetical protein isoform 2 [Galdieria sulphuraria]|eukprot:XP_005704808.1 hypothetical protein isoform 2 [Galdieria sulphuraria]
MTTLCYSSNHTQTLLVKVISLNGEHNKITVTITTCYETQNVANKIFRLKLFDEKDPFLFYECYWDEDSFLVFKHQQNLLVDFQGFGSKFHELLSNCREDKERFQATLSMKDKELATLIIEENTRFRTLTYLSVDLNVASHETIHNHFKLSLNRLYGMIENMQSQVAHLETQLGQEKSKNEQLSNQLHQLESDTERQLEDWKREKERQLNQIREEKKAEREKLWEDLEAQKREDIKVYQDEVLVWKQKAEQWNTEVTHLRELLEQTQKELKGMRSKRDELESQFDQAKADLKTMKQEKEHYLLDLEQKTSRLEELERRNRELSTQIEEWQTQSEFQTREWEKVMKYQRTEQNTKEAFKDKEEKENLKTQLELYRMSRSRLEEKLKSSIGEINKGNSIIEKLQEELKNARQKAKMKTTIANQQEQLLQEKQHKIEQLIQEMQVLNQKVSSKERELEHLNQSFQTCNAKLEENQKVLESNQQLINWLNKELNELQLSSQIFSKPLKSSFATFPSAAAYNKKDRSASNPLDNNPSAATSRKETLVDKA